MKGDVGEIVVRKDSDGSFFIDDRRYADLHLIEAQTLDQLVRKIEPLIHQYLLANFRLVEMNGKVIAKGKSRYAPI